MKMVFKKEALSLKGVYKIHLENFSDERGVIVNLFDVEQLPNFKVEKLSKSKKNVLRGMHGDSINDKLIYCLKGKMHLVVVNYDEKSDQFLEKIEIDINEDSNFAVFVPRNFLNGHYCLTDDCLFYYKWSESYVEPEKQFSVRWNDEQLKIDWPLLESEPVISERDRDSKTLREKK
jgi:dTDP-4-dehydrorhamnose 3,5-epimerase